MKEKYIITIEVEVDRTNFPSVYIMESLDKGWPQQMKLIKASARTKEVKSVAPRKRRSVFR